MNWKNLMMKTRTVKIPSKDFLNKEFKIKKSFDRFNQRNDIFSRSLWDDNINPKKFYASYDIANYIPKKSKGFDHWDFAFRNASWHITDFVGERNFQEDGRVEGFTDYYSTHMEGSPMKVELKSKEETTNKVKLAAKMFGAGVSGVVVLFR